MWIWTSYLIFKLGPSLHQHVEMIYFHGPIIQISQFPLFLIFFQVHPLVLLIKNITQIIRKSKITLTQSRSHHQVPHNIQVPKGLENLYKVISWSYVHIKQTGLHSFHHRIYVKSNRETSKEVVLKKRRESKQYKIRYSHLFLPITLYIASQSLSLFITHSGTHVPVFL